MTASLTDYTSKEAHSMHRTDQNWKPQSADGHHFEGHNTSIFWMDLEDGGIMFIRNAGIHT
jgi:hypothetical protein